MAHNSRSQSAMEYLMTYGWAILVIAIVLFGLYSTGVFGGGSALPNSCEAQSGFLCSSPKMNTTGNVIVTFGEALGVPISITGLGCSNTSTEPSFASNSMTLQPGEETTLTFQCPLASNAIGAAFTGTLWVQYTKNGQTGQASQIATLTAKAVTSNSLGSSGGGSSYTPPTVSLSSCPSPASVTSGSSVSCSATVSGGTSSYTYNWIVVNSITDAVVASQVYTGVSSTSNTFSYTTSSSDTSNSPEAFNVIVTDAHPTTVNSAYSGTFAITSGSSPSGGAYAYVVNDASPYNVVIINTATNTVVNAITSGFNGPTGVAFSPSGTYAYVVNEGANNVVIVDTATNTVVNAIASGFLNPYNVAFSPSGTYAYVANTGIPYNVVIINTATNTVVNAIASGFYNPTGVAFSPSGTYAYVANYDNNNVVIINTATNTVVNAITSGFNGPTGVAFSPDGSYAYVVNDASPYNVVIINTATNTVVNSITSGSFFNPNGVAFSPSGTYAYVVNGASPYNVVIINTATNTVVNAITSGFNGPTGVAFSPS